MIVIDNKFELKQMVFLRTDPEQHRRLITGIRLCADGSILYELSFASGTSWHY